MTQPLSLSGLMHCWLAARAEVAGTSYVALRGVNFRDEYKTGPRAHEGGSRAHHDVGGPWLHVPSVAFRFAPDAPPAPDACAQTAMACAAQDWPALSGAQIVGWDQDLTGQWGATNAANQAEAVTRIALDLGRLQDLPHVKIRPDQVLSWPRHPVFWVKSDDIWQNPSAQPVEQDGHRSAFTLGTPYDIQMEIDASAKTKDVRVFHMPIQHTVAQIFTTFFGPSLFALRPFGPPKEPTLTAAPQRT